MPSQNLGAFLTQVNGIASLIPQAKRVLELRKILAAVLPESLSRSCSIASVKHGKIVIFAANSAVAAKLKLMRPVLSEQLTQRGVEVTGIEVEVQLPGPIPKVIEKSAKISQGAAQSLTRLSTQLPDSELKNVLTKLARRERD